MSKTGLLQRRETIVPQLIDNAERLLRQEPDLVDMEELNGLPFPAISIVAVKQLGLGINNPYGMSLGGTRIINIDFDDYDTLNAAEKEVKELSRDMSRKWITLSGMLSDMVDVGTALPAELRAAYMDGGKSGIVLPKNINIEKLGRTVKEALFHAFGKHVARLGGKYIAAEDSGTKPEHMDIIGDVTSFVACKSEKKGGTGNPSETTAVGVWTSMKALMEKMNEGKWYSTFKIKGTGNVGSRLIDEILREHPHAKIYATDIEPEALKAIAETYPNVVAVDPKEFWKVKADVFIPAARSYDLTSETADLLYQSETKLVCGPANNQFPTVDGEPNPEIVKEFHDKEIVVAPAPLVNLGGILHLALPWAKVYDPSYDFENNMRAREIVQGVGPLVRKLYDLSVREGKPLDEVYLQWVAERYARFQLEGMPRIEVTITNGHTGENGTKISKQTLSRFAKSKAKTGEEAERILLAQLASARPIKGRPEGFPGRKPRNPVKVYEYTEGEKVTHLYVEKKPDGTSELLHIGNVKDGRTYY